MKAVIHIGSAKTGTTTIQNFLGKNRETLKTQGIFISSSAPSWCHAQQVKLAAATCIPTAREFHAAHWFTCQHLKHGFTVADQNKLQEDIRHEIKSNCRKDDIVIFSCEALAIFTEQEIERVKELMVSLFDDIP